MVDRTGYFINDSHFSFFRHDLNKGQDSTAVFSAGAGTYILKGNAYTEHLEYFTFREWEGNQFEFTVAISQDTLIQPVSKRSSSSASIS